MNDEMMFCIYGTENLVPFTVPGTHGDVKNT